MVVHRRRIAIAFLILAIVAVVLSVVWGVPYIYTLIGAAAWVFAGHLITADDDLPGGWSNPDGALPFPWAQLAIKALVLVALLALAVVFPVLRTIGAG